MSPACASPALVATLCAELDALETTLLRSLSIGDARRVLALLHDVDVQLRCSVGVAVPIADSSNGPDSCSAKGDTIRSAGSSAGGTLPRLRSIFVAQLTIPQQDALMRVLYVCMASCASGVTAPTFKGLCGAPTAAQEAYAPLSPAAVLHLYEWHAALHDAAGDGAVVRALMSR
ncbi:putative ARP2/3 complex 16 kDa subunit (p16-Arc) [Leishmania utingensis]|uniref:ARP2/3 complex 16 kDa subunit (p16-Arc) n=1 Tax=Leishmania utingensis TaxID=653362 RepID=A0AAW3AXC5_9TRYP